MGAGSAVPGSLSADLSSPQHLYRNAAGPPAAAGATGAMRPRRNRFDSRGHLLHDRLLLIRDQEGDYRGNLASQSAIGRQRAGTSTADRRDRDRLAASGADGSSRSTREGRARVRSTLTSREYERERDKDRRAKSRSRSRSRVRSRSASRALSEADTETEFENDGIDELDSDDDDEAGLDGPAILHEDDDLWNLREEQRYLSDAYGWTAPETKEPPPAMPDSVLMECIHHHAAQYFHRTGHLGPWPHTQASSKGFDLDEGSNSGDGAIDGAETATQQRRWLKYLFGHHSNLRQQLDSSALVALAVFVEEFVAAMVDPAIEDRLDQQREQRDEADHAAVRIGAAGPQSMQPRQGADPQLAWREAILAEYANNVEQVKQRQEEVKTSHANFTAAMERAILDEQAEEEAAADRTAGAIDGGAEAARPADSLTGPREQTAALQQRLRRLERLRSRTTRFDAVSWELPRSPASSDREAGSTALEEFAAAETGAASQPDDDDEDLDAQSQSSRGSTASAALASHRHELPGPSTRAGDSTATTTDTATEAMIERLTRSQRALHPVVAAATYGQHPLTQWIRDLQGRISQQHLDALTVAAEDAWLRRDWQDEIQQAYAEEARERKERRRKRRERKERHARRRARDTIDSEEIQGGEEEATRWLASGVQVCGEVAEAEAQPQMEADADAGATDGDCRLDASTSPSMRHRLPPVQQQRRRKRAAPIGEASEAEAEAEQPRQQRPRTKARPAASRKPRQPRIARNEAETRQAYVVRARPAAVDVDPTARAALLRTPPVRANTGESADSLSSSSSSSSDESTPAAAVGRGSSPTKGGTPRQLTYKEERRRRQREARAEQKRLKREEKRRRKRMVESDEGDGVDVMQRTSRVVESDVGERVDVVDRSGRVKEAMEGEEQQQHDEVEMQAESEDEDNPLFFRGGGGEDSV